MTKIESIAYSTRQNYWRDFEKEKQLKDVADFEKIVKTVTDVCFISGCGVGFRTEAFKFYQFSGLTSEILDELANGDFFDGKSNAKMWYCCLRYALENKDCSDFWHKYKETSAGTKFMALILGQKETLDDN